MRRLRATGSTPFTDVADWAKPYVGYAYANGLTAGVSQTRFGSESSVTAAQFLTFVLRALGYESGKDFSWDSAWTLTDTLGMTSGQYNAKTNGSFLRADAALVSVFALSTVGKAGKTLYETIFSAKLPQTLSDTIDRLAGRTPKRDTSRAKAGYGTYLDTLHLPDLLGKPQYSQAEIRQMLDYSLDELRDAIYTVPDMIQYIVESGYGVEPNWRMIFISNTALRLVGQQVGAGRSAVQLPKLRRNFQSDALYPTGRLRRGRLRFLVRLQQNRKPPGWRSCFQLLPRRRRICDL